MKIYGNTVSPFYRMCVVTAHEAGVADRLEEVAVSTKVDEVHARLATLSPIAKIPVLETDHGHVLHDSRVIIEYLAHVAGNHTLIPDDGVKRFRILTLLATAQGMADAAVALRYETSARPEALRWPDYMKRLEDRILAAADELDRNFIPCLSEVNVGAIATAVGLDYLDHRHDRLNWREGRPRLAALHQKFRQRESMLAAPLPKA
jgi:glutathione S-transferase